MSKLDLFKIMNGKTVWVDGVMGTLKIECYTAKYPYERLVVKLFHQPNETGKASETYKRIKNYLKDDYDTDLTDSDKVIDIAYTLGLTEEAICELMCR